MKKLLVVSNKVWKAEIYVAWVLMFFVMMLVITNIILRRFFGSPIYGSTELVRYLSLCVASFALAQNEWIDGNITMTLIQERIKSKKAVGIIMAVTTTICALVFILISYLFCMQVNTRITNHDITAELKMPIWIPTLIFAVGAIFLTASLIIKCILRWHRTIKGEPQINFRTLIVTKEMEQNE